MDLTLIAGALLEAAPDAVFVVDARGTILLVNDETERLFGFVRAELVGQSIETVVPAASRTAHTRSRAAYDASPARRRMGHTEVQALRHDGSTFWAAVSLSPIEIGGERLVVAIARDVTERRAMEDRLRFLSSHDTLSGLSSRALFEEQMARLDRGRSFPISVIVADLDGLKAVNDGQGHAAGDQMIKRAAEVLRATFRFEDVIARLGGDEFVVLLEGIGGVTLADTLCRARVKATAAELPISFGGATAEAPGQLDEALKLADRRMYEDKAARRSSATPR